MTNEFDSTTSLIGAIAYATKFARTAEQLEGRKVFPTTAIVVENNDPEFRRRIKIADPSYGGKIVSGWIMAIRVTENSDPPIPSVNQLVMVFYADGDPEKGYYLPLMQDTNPSRNKDNPVDDHSEQVDGNRERVVGGNEKICIENNCDRLIGGEAKTAVAGDINLKGETNASARINQTIDVSCGESITLRTDSGSSITLTSAGFAVIRDAWGRKITLGGIGNGGEWDLAGYALEVINATDFTINGKSIAVLGARDSDGDTLVTRGY